MDKTLIKVDRSVKDRLSIKAFSELEKEYERKNDRLNPSVVLFKGMVWQFANWLPYSMDIEQDKYVPGDFLTIEPKDVNENSWFKWDDRRTFYNAMFNNIETRKSGILLQVCYILQQMILGEVPLDEFKDLSIQELEFVGFGPEYRSNLFNILKKLPTFCQELDQIKDKEARRAKLDKIYKELNSIGDFRQTIKGKNGKECAIDSLGTSPHNPRLEVEMIEQECACNFYGGVPILTAVIRGEQLANYKEKKALRLGQ